MNKYLSIFLIFFLILSTAIIKNSTKRISDEIFTLEEDIRDLNNNFENIKLEYEYLSSPEKLLELQKLYFDEELVKKDLHEIKILNINFDKLNDLN